MDLKNNPHYQNGVYKGTQVASYIEKTSYGTLEAALLKKRELVQDFRKRFGWDDSRKEVAETLGIIAALEQEQENKSKN